MLAWSSFCEETPLDTLRTDRSVERHDPLRSGECFEYRQLVVRSVKNTCWRCSILMSLFPQVGTRRLSNLGMVISSVVGVTRREASVGQDPLTRETRVIGELADEPSETIRWSVGSHLTEQTSTTCTLWPGLRYSPARVRTRVQWALMTGWAVRGPTRWT